MSSQNQLNNTIPDANFTVPNGSITAGTGVTATAGNIEASAGNVFALGGTLISRNNDAATTPPFLYLQKTRSGGAITTGDFVGQMLFRGQSGSGYVSAAGITVMSSGTIGAGRIAGSMVFSTHPDSASGSAATDRMTIASTGAVTIAAPDSGTGLTVSGGGFSVTDGGATITSVANSFTTQIAQAQINTYGGANTTGCIFTLDKTRSGGAITTGDALGYIRFRAESGSGLVIGAAITCTSSGTIGANRVASNMVFATHPDSTSGGAAATTRMTIASTGAVTIAAPDSGTGLTISGGGSSTTGRADFANGISFDAGTNTLSNYVAKTSFTPVLSFGAATTGITYGSQSGWYSRVGSTITFMLTIVLTSKGTATGVASIAGLPNSPALSGSYPVSFSNLTYTNQVFVRASGANLELRQAASGGVFAQLTDANFANNTRIEISGSYIL